MLMQFVGQYITLTFLIDNISCEWVPSLARTHKRFLPCTLMEASSMFEINVQWSVH